MTTLGWLALACAVVVLPGPSRVATRMAALAESERLVADTSVVAAPPVHARTGPSVALVGVGVAALVALLCGPALGVSAMAVAVSIAVPLRAHRSARRTARRGSEVLIALRLVVAELEAGARPADALAAAAAAAPDLESCLRQAASVAATGGDTAQALLDGDATDLVPLAHAWRVASAAGAPVAEVVGRIADDSAAEQSHADAVTAALAGPRSTAMMLAVLPVVGLALGAALGAHPLLVLFGSPAGRLICCAGCVLDAAGVLWADRLLRRAQRA